MRFPSIASVRAELVRLNRLVDPSDDEQDSCDVRLQVYDDGGWAVRYGDPSYDTDHRGFWGGSSSIPGNSRRFNATETARELIEQAREQRDAEESSEAGLRRASRERDAEPPIGYMQGRGAS